VEVVTYSGVSFEAPVSVTRNEPTKPVGFHWRERDIWELRQHISSGESRIQPYIRGMSQRSWEKMYDEHDNDTDRLKALAAWIRVALDKKGIA
jgi:hypothetical protein